jgi:hypothetical protein
VKLRLNCALEVRIEEGRRGRWGEMAGGGAGGQRPRGQGRRGWRLGMTPTGGALLPVRERGRERRWAGATGLGQAGPRWEEKKGGECWAAGEFGVRRLG